MSQSRRIEEVMLDGLSRRSVLIFGRAYQALTSATPVRFGFARAGWTPAVGFTRVGPANPPLSEEANRSLSASLFSNNRAFVAGLPRAYDVRRGALILATAVSYIPPLNAGSSSQAPSNFIERAIATAVASVPSTL